MQFLGRTEFGLSVMAVERHTRYTPRWETLNNKKKTYKDAIIAAHSFRTLPHVFHSANRARWEIEREWLS